MKAIKSYVNYTPKLYRILIFIVFPLILAGVTVIMVAYDAPVYFMLSVVGVELFYEIFADNWMLNGIQSREHTGVRLILAAPEGLKYMKNVILLDCLRRYAYLLIMFLAYIIPSLILGRGTYIMETLFIIWNIFWLAGALMSLFIWICRYFANISIILLITYLAALAYAILAGIGVWGKWSCIVYPVVSLIVSGISVLTGWKKMEECYYD